MSSLDLEDGQDDAGGKPKPARRGRPPKTETTADLKRSLQEQLEELAQWIALRDDELGETFAADVPRMAAFLAERAAKHSTLARVLRVAFAPDGPLAALRAFGRTVRIFGTRIAARRAHEEAEDGTWVDEHGNTRDATGQIVVPHA